jgi:hypothetical protein
MMKNIFNTSPNNNEITFAKNIRLQKKLSSEVKNWFNYIFNYKIYTQIKTDLTTKNSSWIAGWSGVKSLQARIYNTLVKQGSLCVYILNEEDLSYLDINPNQPTAIIGQNCSINFFDDLLDNYDFFNIFFSPLSQNYIDFDTVKHIITNELKAKRKLGLSITTQDILPLYEKYVISKELKEKLLSHLKQLKILEDKKIISPTSNNTIKEFVDNNFSIIVNTGRLDELYFSVNNVFLKYFDALLTQEKRKDYHLLAPINIYLEELIDIKTKHIFVISGIDNHLFTHFAWPQNIQLILSHIEDPSADFFSYIDKLVIGYQYIVKKYIRFGGSSQLFLKNDFQGSITKKSQQEIENHTGFLITPHLKEISNIKYVDLSSSLSYEPDVFEEKLKQNEKKFLNQFQALKEKLYLENQMNHVANENIIKPVKKHKI